jgi:hypothetical protein
MVNIKAEGPSPLWRGYIYRGTYTQLAGDSGMGKTFIGCDLLARASRGGPWPGETETFKPLRCLILSSEDAAGTFAERLQAAEADQKQIDLIDTVPPLSQADDYFKGYDIVFAETLDLHLPTGTSTNDNLGVRLGLQPALAALRKHRVALVGARHWNKADGKTGLYRASGAVAFTAASRVSLSASMDGTKQRWLTVEKCNLAPKRSPIAYSISSTLNVEWGDRDYNASPGLRPEVADAVTFLRALLANGGKTAKEIRAAANGEAIPYALLHAAKIYLGIRPKKIGFRGGWEWKLPIQPEEGPPVVDLRDLGALPEES